MSLKENESFKNFFIGAFIYFAVELLWRGHSHWTMAVIGGVCFVLIYKLSRRMSRSPLWLKCLAGTGVITTVEFVCGIIVNKQFRLNVWDYSSEPLNIMGQICLPYCVLWFLLCIPAFWLSDYINYSRERKFKTIK